MPHPFTSRLVVHLRDVSSSPHAAQSLRSVPLVISDPQPGGQLRCLTEAVPQPAVSIISLLGQRSFQQVAPKWGKSRHLSSDICARPHALTIRVHPEDSTCGCRQLCVLVALAAARASTPSQGIWIPPPQSGEPDLWSTLLIKQLKRRAVTKPLSVSETADGTQRRFFSHTRQGGRCGG